ncbi:DUF1840 domain-containing protein [Vibrio hepatarius]|uniref:DUF1840 domain-containing protein n=1 Tax=Vibrio hepatarius TaxID=171383 RepID=UPI00142E38C0|nr:DUF1840 domain-containing protein [Vibrio hepatarius]NIY82994.1 DUF1840 domain-containing protein [Vibrio hepatarius]NVJ55242.1 DUF1840 domain-containing protein [Vibrionaceae bacterium]
MLVTFRTKAYANVTMFGNVALEMIKMMGHSETVPGAITAENVPTALEQFKAAVAIEKNKPDPEEVEDDEEDAEPQVSIATRALPLLELLTAAAKDDCDVMWDKE